MRTRNFKKTLGYVTRLIGLDGKNEADIEALKSEKRFISADVQFDKDSGKPFVKIDNENITIESFMAGILKKLYCNMNKGLEQDGLPLVLGVPSYATDYHKKALLKASYIADIKNVRVVEESSAILYDFLKDNVKELK